MNHNEEVDLDYKNVTLNYLLSNKNRNHTHTFSRDIELFQRHFNLLFSSVNYANNSKARTKHAEGLSKLQKPIKMAFGYTRIEKKPTIERKPTTVLNSECFGCSQHIYVTSDQFWWGKEEYEKQYELGYSVVSQELLELTNLITNNYKFISSLELLHKKNATLKNRKLIKFMGEKEELSICFLSVALGLVQRVCEIKQEGIEFHPSKPIQDLAAKLAIKLVEEGVFGRVTRDCMDLAAGQPPPFGKKHKQSQREIIDILIQHLTDKLTKYFSFPNLKKTITDVDILVEILKLSGFSSTDTTVRNKITSRTSS